MSTKSETVPRRRLSGGERRAKVEAAAAELFAERGYRGASIEAIARRSGVTPPVVYDHFPSKLDLYRQLLEANFAELRAIWGRGFPGDEQPRQRAARAFDGWFAYVEEHPAACRLLFREPAGDPEAEAVHAEVAGASRAAVMKLFAAEPGAGGLTGSVAGEGLEMAWVVLRGVLQGLALWWVDHPEVPRERVVATAMNSLWIGFERAAGGEAWTSDQLDQPG
ncbi:MAG TPA: TetR/AcrR family transcriptional regulator [Solirubrobacterales bacterium]|nr:TetR/AcrR family transcriptional regulator [Solirubrobacterales bacterium]